MSAPCGDRGYLFPEGFKPYCLWIEEHGKPVYQYGYHLGTDFAIAEKIAIEYLRNRQNSGVITVSLRREGEETRIYDWRSLEETDDWEDA